MRQEVDPSDMDLFNRFMPSSSANSIIQSATQRQTDEGQGTNLADLILEKIAAHEAGQIGQPIVHGGGMLEDAVELPAKVVEVYSKCALFQLGRHYRSYADCHCTGLG